MDTMLEVMSMVPVEWRSIKGEEAEIISRIELVLNALFGCYLFRSSHIVDRLPALLQRFRSAMASLAVVAANFDPDKDYLIAPKLQSCAHKIQKYVLL